MTLSWSPSEGILQYSLSLFPANWIDYPFQTSPLFVNVRQYPQCFFRLRKPIVVPPPANTYTFGNTNIGSNIDTLYDVIPYINFVKHTCSSNVTVSKIYARLPATTGKYKFAIYSNSSSLPNTLLGSTTEVTNPSSVNWYSADLLTPVSLTSNTDYWIAIWSDSPNGRVYYTDTSKTLRWRGLAYGSWPTTANSSGGSFANYCLYAK
jgi:hypothetical protein